MKRTYTLKYKPSVVDRYISVGTILRSSPKQIANLLGHSTSAVTEQ